MKSLTPEQMRRRWFALGIVALAYILSFFQRFAPAGIAQDLAASFETSAASLGILAATYFYVYTLMQVPTGILVDTLGPRRILALGGLIGGAGSFLFGFAPSLELALVGRTLIGLGVVGHLHCHAQAGGRLVRGKPLRHHGRHLHADRQSRFGAGRVRRSRRWPKRPAGVAYSSVSALLRWFWVPCAG